LTPMPLARFMILVQHCKPPQVEIWTRVGGALSAVASVPGPLVLHGAGRPWLALAAKLGLQLCKPRIQVWLGVLGLCTF
jgi:hypothetical protein